ncbi:MAG TPA: diphthine--ammonia ligase [Candidatus Bathyarchaeia archaeon]|nr:diphthine--ammonia ligase [Candidatus Bathyarchaeia archaeon]
MKLIASWSGGKDSCFALHKAQQQGHTIQNLLIMMQDQGKSNFHMISTELLDAQSEALGIPITKQPTTPETYEQQFKKALREAKVKGAQGLVTGDIFDVAQHEAGWLERICANVGLTPVKPLWHRDTTQVLNEFINVGFKAIVVRVKTAVLGMEYLGRTIDTQFFNDLKKLGNVDLCGEYGEYHTFVIDGPIFKKKIEIQETKTSTINGWGRLEITKFALKPKTKGG